MFVYRAISSNSEGDSRPMSWMGVASRHMACCKVLCTSNEDPLQMVEFSRSVMYTLKLLLTLCNGYCLNDLQQMICNLGR